MPYLDICQSINKEISAPCFAYQVSGEYAMIEAAANNGWIERDKVIFESLLSFKRAGCAGILTYHAIKMAEILDSPL
jgi:porphobilinogen synthase